MGLAIAWLAIIAWVGNGGARVCAGVRPEHESAEAEHRDADLPPPT